MQQFQQKQETSYLNAEKTWNSLTTDAEKKFMSWQHLSWCKRIRDCFDDFTSEDNQNTSEDNQNTSEDNQNTSEDNQNTSEEMDQHEIKWADRVTIWRRRFNEFHPPSQSNI